MPVYIDRLLETLIRRKASELRCRAGVQPQLYLDSQFRGIVTKVLTEDDVMQLIRAITPDADQRTLGLTGAAKFSFAYGDAGKFDVAIQTRETGRVLIIRPAD